MSVSARPCPRAARRFWQLLRVVFNDIDRGSTRFTIHDSLHDFGILDIVNNIMNVGVGNLFTDALS